MMEQRQEEKQQLCYERKKANTVYVSATTNPQVIEVIKRMFGHDIKIELVPEKNGVTDIEAQTMIDSQFSCLCNSQIILVILKICGTGEVVHM